MNGPANLRRAQRSDGRQRTWRSLFAAATAAPLALSAIATPGLRADAPRPWSTEPVSGSKVIQSGQLAETTQPPQLNPVPGSQPASSAWPPAIFVPSQTERGAVVPVNYLAQAADDATGPAANSLHWHQDNVQPPARMRMQAPELATGDQEVAAPSARVAQQPGTPTPDSLFPNAVGTPPAGPLPNPLPPGPSVAPYPSQASVLTTPLDPNAAVVPEGVEPVVLPFRMRQYTQEITVTRNQSIILEYNADIARVAVTNQGTCEVNLYTPQELGLLGMEVGTTTLTLWFKDPRFDKAIYLIRVRPDPEVQRRREEHFRQLENWINEEYPNSKVRLVVKGDKLFVKGQARDNQEAHEILNMLRNDPRFGGDNGGFGFGANSFVGNTSDPYTEEEAGTRAQNIQVINRLMVPGVQQVALKIKVAQLSRSAARNFGVDVDATVEWSNGAFLIQSLLNSGTDGNGPSIIGQFDEEDIIVGLRYLEQHGVIRMISEPTLVTLSGQPAQFLSGGEFAVPTTVGVGGASAVTTDFRAFGTIVSFLPTVYDKDKIRLYVSPEFSKINAGNSVNGTPGLDTNSVTTTVELNEGQTMALAGLLDDSMSANKTGDLPFLSQIFGQRSVTRNETELIILVTPELVHPMDPEEVPPLPGFDVTEPTNPEFFIMGYLEGRPTHDYRSTVWPHLMRRYRAGGSWLGQFGHGQ